MTNKFKIKKNKIIILTVIYNIIVKYKKQKNQQ